MKILVMKLHHWYIYTKVKILWNDNNIYSFSVYNILKGEDNEKHAKGNDDISGKLKIKLKKVSSGIILNKN